MPAMSQGAVRTPVCSLEPCPLQEEPGLIWAPQVSVPPANSPRPMVVWFLLVPLCPHLMASPMMAETAVLFTQSSLCAPVSPHTCPPVLCPPGAVASQPADPPSSERLPLGSAPALQETRLRSTLTSAIRLRVGAGHKHSACSQETPVCSQVGGGLLENWLFLNT